MKTLVFFGSARKKGNTKDLLNIFLEHLKGEVEVIDAYRTEVGGCIDCRYCWENRGCSVQDDMQSIYDKIDNADNIVFASPLYFNNVPGPLKNIIDRCQVYWASRRRKDRDEISDKKAALLVVGGAPSYNNQFLAMEIVLEGVLKDMKAEVIGHVYVPNSDKVPVLENEEAIQMAKTVAENLNKANKNK